MQFARVAVFCQVAIATKTPTETTQYPDQYNWGEKKVLSRTSRLTKRNKSSTCPLICGCRCPTSTRPSSRSLISLTTIGSATHYSRDQCVLLHFCSRTSRRFHSNRQFNSYSMSNLKLKSAMNGNVQCFRALASRPSLFVHFIKYHSAASASSKLSAVGIV